MFIIWLIIFFFIILEVKIYGWFWLVEEVVGVGVEGVMRFYFRDVLFGWVVDVLVIGVCLVEWFCGIEIEFAFW